MTRGVQAQNGPQNSEPNLRDKTYSSKTVKTDDI